MGLWLILLKCLGAHLDHQVSLLFIFLFSIYFLICCCFLKFAFVNLGESSNVGGFVGSSFVCEFSGCIEKKQYLVSLLFFPFT